MLELKVTWILLSVVEVDLVLVRGSNLNCFGARVKIDLVFVCGPGMLVFSVGID